MKKILSILTLLSFSGSISSYTISCINIEQNKHTFFKNVIDKINNTNKNSWKDNSITDLNGNCSLVKNNENKPASWISMLTNVFDLKTSNNPNEDEMKFVTNISSNDNILKDGIKEEVSITLTLDTKRPNQNITTIKKTLTWHNEKISEDNLETETINAINDATNINAKGENLSINANDALTTSAIFNNIGFSDAQKAITTLSGVLTKEKEKEILFKVNDKEINKNVGLYTKGNGSIATKNIISTIQFNGKYYAIENNSEHSILASTDGINYHTLLNFGIYLFALYNFQNQLYLATGKGVYKYNGNSFITIDNNFNKYTYTLSSYNNELYAGTFNNGVYKYNGKTFIKIDSAFNLQIYSLITYENILYVGTHNGIFKLNNNTFEKIDNEFNNYTYALEIYNNKLYIGTNDGLYSFNNSTNKVIVTDDSFNHQIYSIKTYNDKLYIGTNDGLWMFINKTFTNLKILKTNVYINLNFDHSLTISSGYLANDEQSKNISYYYAS